MRKDCRLKQEECMYQAQANAGQNNIKVVLLFRKGILKVTQDRK